MARLLTVPGIGHLTAMAIKAFANPALRHPCAAYSVMSHYKHADGEIE